MSKIYGVVDGEIRDLRDSVEARLDRIIELLEHLLDAQPVEEVREATEQAGKAEGAPNE